MPASFGRTPAEIRSLVSAAGGRGDRASASSGGASGCFPGVCRLRLPLPWPGVPHCNAWAVAAGDGFVLFDTGMHAARLARRTSSGRWRCAACGSRTCACVVCTHAHSDHCGQAAPIVERAGCELWMHPNHELHGRMVEDPEAALARRLEVARQSGVPEEPLRRYAAERARRESGHRRPSSSPTATSCPASTSSTDLGAWTVHETPGHAPSHVCLFQPERRLLISGDHLLGRISLYFDYGYSPDPVGEFLRSLDVVERARRAPVPARPRPHVHRRPRPHRRQPRARRRAPGPRLAARRERRADRLRGRPARLRRRVLAADGALAADRDARLPDPPGGAGEARARIAGEPERWRRLHNSRTMRIDELLAGETARSSRSSSSRPRPTAGRAQPVRALWPSCARSSPSFVSVTYGAGGSTREKTIEIVKRIKRDYGLEAMAHFTCVGATVHELRATLDEMRAAGIDNVLALRGDPPAGPGGVDQDRGRPRVLPRAGRADPRRLPVRDRRRLLPGDAHPRGQPRGRPAHLAEKVDAGVDFLITQLFFDNALYFDFVARARAAGIEVPIIPGIMPITQRRPDRAHDRRCAAPRSPSGLRRELHARGEDPEAVLDFGVAYATLQCAELLAAGAPGIHFYTLNRSPATRAILSALKLARPWETGRLPGSISSPSATRGEPSAAS